MPMPIRIDTNMAAGNQQKHLSEFYYKNVNLSLEEFKNITEIILL